ncbi:YTX2-like protein, partial [Mya arenaria]
NLLDYIEQKDITACFINLDQEKAFDKVSWPYMFSVLQSFGFDDKFIKWIKVLYNDVSTSVIVNGHISNPFQLERTDVYGHITLKTPVLVRSPKLSNVEPG